MIRRVALLLTMLWAAGATAGSVIIPTSPLSDEVYFRQARALEEALTERGLLFGSPIYIQIFKASRELDLYVMSRDGYELFRTYEICEISGGLGPKLVEGDEQAPEGFYTVSAEWLNPESEFHLSFNLGFPNGFDQFHERTGSMIMVHGGCVSRGCFAMSNRYIEEIYTLAEAALRESQRRFKVHVFPFRMSEENMALYQHSRWYDFWTQLKPGYDYFAEHRYPPYVRVEDGRYVVEK